MVIKPTDTTPLQIKLIDFGCADYYIPNQTLTKHIGTLQYMAPGVIVNEYTNKCDVWSVGIITYILIFGTFPFDGETDYEVAKKVCQT